MLSEKESKKVMCPLFLPIFHDLHCEHSIKRWRCMPLRKIMFLEVILRMNVVHCLLLFSRIAGFWAFAQGYSGAEKIGPVVSFYPFIVLYKAAHWD